jgi:Asp-tRNA(Asn)/Glu-tRNA(Gln) amidotransferase A subunit family amidase
MPIGLSLVSGRYRDQKLVAVAKEVAKVFKGAHGDKIRQLSGVPSGLL